MTKPPLPRPARLTLPEAVSLIEETFECNLDDARDALERALIEESVCEISTKTFEGVETSTPFSEWLEIDWNTGEVEAEASHSGSPPTFVTIIPLLKRQEIDQHFSIGADQAARIPQSARTQSGGNAHASDRTLENDDISQRIDAVLFEAKERLTRNHSLSIHRIAERMVDDGDGHGFKAETIRKILSGKYEPARRRGFHGLGAGHFG